MARLKRRRWRRGSINDQRHSSYIWFELRWSFERSFRIDFRHLDWANSSLHTCIFPNEFDRHEEFDILPSFAFDCRVNCTTAWVIRDRCATNGSDGREDLNRSDISIAVFRLGSESIDRPWRSSADLRETNVDRRNGKSSILAYRECSRRSTLRLRQSNFGVRQVSFWIFSCRVKFRRICSWLSPKQTERHWKWVMESLHLFECVSMPFFVHLFPRSETNDCMNCWWWWGFTWY